MEHQADSDKCDTINSLLLADVVDVAQLRRLARQPGGFQTNELRRRIWPKLLQINRYDTDDYKAVISPYRDDNQVWCDVTRLWGWEKAEPAADDWRLTRHRKIVADVIKAVLCKHSSLYYYQGYHDVASVCVSVLGEGSLAFQVLQRITLTRLADHMQRTMQISSHTLHITMHIVHLEDPELYALLLRHAHLCPGDADDDRAAPVPAPFFSTPWVLTWLAHSNRCLGCVARVFDALLSSHPLYIYYLSAALVLRQRERLFGACAAEAAGQAGDGVHRILPDAAQLAHGEIDDVVLAADALMERIRLPDIQQIASEALKKILHSERLLITHPLPCLRTSTAPSDCLLLRQRQVDWCIHRYTQLHGEGGVHSFTPPQQLPGPAEESHDAGDDYAQLLLLPLRKVAQSQLGVYAALTASLVLLVGAYAAQHTQGD